MALPRGILLLLVVVAAVSCQNVPCVCKKNKRTFDCVSDGSLCTCKVFGSNVTVNCETLTSKCLLMKAEVFGTRSGRRDKPANAHLDNDGIYDPECDDKGNFKAKQCNGTSTCWCVNSAGVRRTEKGDKNITCNEVVRTSWIIIETKHSETAASIKDSVEGAVKMALSQRYHLNPKHIHVMYEKPSILIDLKQNASEKSSEDVDIADVAYYLEKDVKEDSLILDSSLNIMIQGEPLQLRDTLIYYVDEKAPEFSMKRLTAGVIAVIVVVILAIVAGILVLVFTRSKRGKYEKAEVKEMNEIHRELNS
ncbi:epithelial cell adhesion molecule [Varanus komodoensis]|uniref:epithelial cell adhesion molecule n=1 Tax=Varanus komodoensis TaxID=61221 RepID=UPI001CF79ACF|nr:epithelial cell adhesion molecule [Varanus komodoensis]